VIGVPPVGTGGGHAPGWPEPSELIPHGPPMLMLARVGRVSDDALEGTCRIPPESAYAESGVAPGFVGLELAAQAAAACEAIRRRGSVGEPAPRLGYLVACRQATLSGPLPLAERLTVSIRMTGAALPFCTYSFLVGREGSDLAEGTLGTWIAD